MNELIFLTLPKVTLATNTFINVPVILKFDDINLIELIKEEKIGFTTQIPIFHPDGTYLAKVNGTRLYLTDDGKKAGLKIEKKADVWECKMEKQTLFEIQHTDSHSFKTQAELYTPTGHFVKFNESPTPGLIDMSGNELKVGGLVMSGSTIQHFKTGIWIKSDGSMRIGVNG
jgi:hypothetical protein